MQEIILYMSDISTQPHYARILYLISLSVDTSWHLHHEEAMLGPHGIGDLSRYDEDIAPVSLRALHMLLQERFPQVLTMADLLCNEDLISFYLSQPQAYDEIEACYVDEIMARYKKATSDDLRIDLAVLYQAYGRFLKVVDLPRAIDPFQREKQLLETVVSHQSDSENRHNMYIAYLDLIDAYEALGPDFNVDVLQLYLSLYYEMSANHEPPSYDLGHICERIGILYSEIDTLEDLDNIDADDERLTLSIAYHRKERDIFHQLYQASRQPDDFYNYGISLRQLGKRYEALGTQDDYHHACSYYRQAHEVMKDLYEKDARYRDTYIISLEHLGDIAYLLHQDDTALAYYARVYDYEAEDAAVSQEIDDLFAVAVIQKKKGRVLLRLHHDADALACFEDALALTRQTKQVPTYEHLSEEGISYMNLGWYYLDRNLPQALTCFSRDLSIREQLYREYQTITAHYSLSLAYRHMGYVYEKENDYAQAVIYFKRCLDIAARYGQDSTHDGERHYLNVSRHDLAYCLMMNGQYQEALPIYEALISELDRLDDKKTHDYPLVKEDIMCEYRTLLGLI